MSNLIVSPMSKLDIVKMVREIKAIIGADEDLFFPVTHFLENLLPLIDDKFQYEYVDKKEMPNGTYAFYNPITNKMTIREDVYDRACKGVGRDRFTIAHEIGHYFLHADEVVVARNENSIYKAYTDPEWQANKFAAELLIPSDLTRHMMIHDIVERCGVSLQAAMISKK